MNTKILGFDPLKAWEYENGFHLMSPVSRLAKILAHYDLYKSIIDLPGNVVECGVYKGASLLQFAAFREVLESPDSRRIIGFDTFGRFPRHGETTSGDSTFIDRFENDGGDGLTMEDLQTVIDGKGFRNIELVAGDILDTVPSYARRHKELRVVLLHIDVDVYLPSVTILEHLFDRVVPGGLVVFDDYGTVEGETDAVDQFLSTRNLPLRKLPISHVPAYVRK